MMMLQATLNEALDLSLDGSTTTVRFQFLNMGNNLQKKRAQKPVCIRFATAT